MSDFIPGIELCRRFYEEAVRPIMPPDLPYAAALIGPGSDVLGFDTQMSMDHDWGPRLLLFLGEEDLATRAAEVDHALGEHLPAEFMGFPTRYAQNENGTKALGGTDHAVVIRSARGYLLDYLGYDIECALEASDWLRFPEQKLRSLVSGAVYHDEVGLSEVIETFRYYPHDIWLYQLASCWQRISQEEHLVGRAGYVADELGASIIASRLVRDAMRLAFLMERTYAPYTKWFGTGFSRLRCASVLQPLLLRVTSARGWQVRDGALVAMLESLAQIQNALGLVEPLSDRATAFYDRPFHVMTLHSPFPQSLRSAISDPLLRDRPLVGGVDFVSDNTDILCSTVPLG